MREPEENINVKSARWFQRLFAEYEAKYHREPTFAEVCKAAEHSDDPEQYIGTYILTNLSVKIRSGGNIEPEEWAYIRSMARDEQGVQDFIKMAAAQAGMPVPRHLETYKPTYRERLTDIYDQYTQLPPQEKEETDRVLLGVASLFGYGEKAAQVKNIIEGEKSTLNQKAAALDKLFREYEQALLDHPEQARTLKYVYEEEKRKILES